MSKREIDKNMIPVHSEEAGVIIGKLFDKAVSIFEKHNINMPLTELQAKGKYTMQTVV